MRTLKISFLIFILSFMTPLTAQSQWTLAYNFPEGGGVENLYFVDNNHGWFVGNFSPSGYRILHTTDGGYTFSAQDVPSGTYNLWTVFFEDTLTGWAIGGPVNNDAGAILKTTNGGGTWNLIIPPGPQPSGWCAVSKAGNTVIIGGQTSQTDVIIIKSTNGGSSWQMQQHLGFGTCADMYVFDAQNYVIGGMNGNLRRTTNGGVTWVSANLDPGYVVYGIEFINQTLGYALVVDWNNFPIDHVYLYKTTDSGFTWNVHYSWINQGCKSELFVVPQVGTIFIGGYLDSTGNGRSVEKSLDGGLTWSTEFQTLSEIDAIQCPDPQHGWILDGWIYRYDYQPPATITRSIELNQGWNMISMPVDAENDSAIVNFPLLQGNAYGFNGSYYPAYTLQNGYGYWVKYPTADSVSTTGVYLESIGFNVPSAGWTMLGSVSEAVGLSSLYTIPAGCITGNVYKFENGSYQVADSLKPGNGYWIKLTQPCHVIIDSSP